MSPRSRIAGMAGVASGIGLAAEFALFMASGWTPATFDNPVATMTLFAKGGTELRAAGAVGLVNLALWLMLLGGLSDRLGGSAPTRARTGLYFGLVGATAHSLVPLGLWAGVPMFVGMIDAEPTIALAAWPAYSVVQAAATGVGYLFGGAAVFSIAAALSTVPGVSRPLAWTGILAGGTAILPVAGMATPLGALAGTFFLPGLLLSVAFRIWAGYALWRGRLSTASLPARTAEA